jgi:hypothetical protein
MITVSCSNCHADNPKFPRGRHRAKHGRTSGTVYFDTMAQCHLDHFSRWPWETHWQPWPPWSRARRGGRRRARRHRAGFQKILDRCTGHSGYTDPRSFPCRHGVPHFSRFVALRRQGELKGCATGMCCRCRQLMCRVIIDFAFLGRLRPAGPDPFTVRRVRGPRPPDLSRWRPLGTGHSELAGPPRRAP